MSRDGVLPAPACRAAGFLLLVGCLAGLAGGSRAAAVPGGGTTLAAIEEAERAGELTYGQAGAQKLYLLFDPERLDERYRREELRPLRCGTPLLDELWRNRDRLDEATRALLDEHLGVLAEGAFPTAQTSVYETTNFYIEYVTVGANGVPTVDVDPANGTPDFVERVGESCEFSRGTEVGTLGYNAPPGTQPGSYNNKYLIQFQNQGSYGFTSVVSGQRTKIVLDNNFLGFPPNDDPDGDQLGAMKVTVAHELKHAIQRTYTSWTEGGWVELDATWMEDIVYDATNDYYNYLSAAGSPFSDPELSLDNDGTNTTGSYEDCNWQHYQTEKLGNTHMRSFWTRRQSFPGEAVMTTYSQNLIASGSSLNEAWGEYVAWNFASGARALGGYGYGEAASYPTTPAASTHAALPVAAGGTVPKLAANTRLVMNGAGTLGGTPTFAFSGAAATPWQVSVLSADRLGNLTRSTMTVVSGVGSLELTGVDWTDLEWAALVIGNAATSGGAASYTVTIDYISPLRIAHQQLWNTTDDVFPYEIEATVAAGTAVPDADAVAVRYRVDGGSEVVVPMTLTPTPDLYEATIPAQPVGSTIEYRIEAESIDNEFTAYPALPGGFLAFDVVTVFEPFEVAGGWTVGAPGDLASTGVWERVVPLGTAAQPGEDTTLPPGTSCFVTENGTVGGALGEADVDGGRTTLLSPIYDLSAGGPYASVTARYRRWYSNALGATTDDTWIVEASNDGGSSWTVLETLTLGDESWVQVTSDLLALLGSPGALRFRFLAEDQGEGSLVEAGIDDFELIAVAEEPVAVGERPPAFRLGPASPNPSTGGGVGFALELPAASPLRAWVVDAAGRRVRSLVPDGTVYPAGSHQLLWDARGEGGVRLAAGVYFLAAETPFGRAQRKVILLR